MDVSFEPVGEVVEPQAPVDVLLVTCQALPEGEPGHELLDAELGARGISSRWVSWDDPFVDWSSAKVVAVRSTWDYDTRHTDFLAWAASVGPALLHGPEVFRWNTDKAYLAELQEGGRIPVVPTVVATDLLELRSAISRFEPAFVKPRVGAGGRGMAVVLEAEGWMPADSGPWVVQPVVHTVKEEGEISVFVIGGRPVSQVRKVAPRHDFRVHEEYGGVTNAEKLSPDAAMLAADAIAVVSETLGVELVYGRVDLMRYDGNWVVSEIEVTEPGLYLDELPGNAELFVDALAMHLT